MFFGKSRRDLCYRGMFIVGAIVCLEMFRRDLYYHWDIGVEREVTARFLLSAGAWRGSLFPFEKVTAGFQMFAGKDRGSRRSSGFS
jgi:hypothetical protein